MVNILGGTQVYDTMEMNSMMQASHGFVVVHKLPPIQTANIGLIYYKTISEAITEVKGYRKIDDSDFTDDLTPEPDATHVIPVLTSRPALVPYIVGIANGHRVWYTIIGKSAKSSPLTDEEILEIWHRYDSIG